MPHNAAFHQGISTLFGKSKNIFRERNTNLVWKLQHVTPQYIKWTIPSLLYRTRRKNPLVYKRLLEIISSLLRPFFSLKVDIPLKCENMLNAGQKYCRMLQGEHSAILLICINLPFVFKTFVLFIFEWPMGLNIFYFSNSN